MVHALLACAILVTMLQLLCIELKRQLEMDWLFLSVPAQQVNGFLADRKFNPWKWNTWNLIVKTFIIEGRKSKLSCRHQRRNTIPLVNDFAEGLKIFALEVLCFQQFQSQMLISLQILLSSRLMKMLKLFVAITVGLVNELMLRKGIIAASKVHSVFANMNNILETTGGCVSIWSLCQNISGLFFTNPDLPAPKYGWTMEMEAADNFSSQWKR